MEEDLTEARNEAIEFAKEQARVFAKELGESSTIRVCQGKPACDFFVDTSLSEDEQISKMQEQVSCPYCTLIMIHEDGTETVTEPSKQ